MKALKEKAWDRLFKQDQSVQTVHMLCKPKPHYDDQRKVAIGYENPLYLTRALQVQPVLYNGHEILKSTHVPVIIHNSEDTLELAKITRKKINAKMKTPLWTEQNINIRPTNYLKSNYLATFTPQTQLTPEQRFWSNDLIKIHAKALNAKAKSANPNRTMAVYHPNTPAKLVPKVLPTKKRFEGIQTALVKEIKEMKEVFEQMEAEVDQHAIDKKRDEIEQKNLLIENENLIADCLSKDVFYTATASVLTVSRFSDMHDAFTAAQKRIAELESENSNLKNKIQNDDHDVMIKHFSKLEVEHLNLQLKYQHLKERFGNKKSVTSSDAPTFDSVFVIGQLKEQVQSRGNTIRELKEKISRLTKKHSDADPILDLKALDSQNKDLTAKVNALHDLNEHFRAENEKVKQHYKELYDLIKITRAKTIEKTNSLLTEIENLKAQIKGKSKCVTMPTEKPKVLAPGRYDIDVEPIHPRNRNNREVHLDYLKHLKESVETLHGIVEEVKVVRPLDSSLASARFYTKHSHELLEYVIGTCPKDFNTRDKQHASTHLTKKKQVTFKDQCERLNIQQSNVPVIPSTRVKGATAASRSNPRSNTKKNRTLPAKSDIRKVEAHHRNNNTRHSPSDSTPNANQAIDASMPFAAASAFMANLSSASPIYDEAGSSYDSDIISEFIGTVRFRNDLFSAIMGYRDYVIGDSVISRVYYVERLGHNLFLVGQFCDSDLEVAFKKHSCYVCDTDGVELIKGSRGSNLYTISIEDMMKSSPICLLSKASKHKSWLWHHHLNHLNFGTINDLARKDLVRGLPRLKFEKDHLCSTCQLKKSKKAYPQT
ncbi:retrovirus-related pol polyprotein from transposon TNT 1-94 [Tanacetum coccineum]